MTLFHRQAVGMVDRVAPLEAHALIDTAMRNTGSADFSDWTFGTGLARLLAALASEAQLGVFGHLATRFDILRCLRNLLCMEVEERRDARILHRSLGRPVFITGLPRSGSTFLHSLLALDPANVAPLSWQVIYPYPRRGDSDPGEHRRACVERQLTLFRLLAPGLSTMHPLRADTPQECTDITAQVFCSLRFDTIYRIPSYREWVDQHGHEAAYAFHRRFLRHLDAQGPEGRQWVLKSPDHVFALEALVKVYPEAHIVMLHRDPLKVMASVARLTELLRRPFTRHLDRVAIGREVSARWVQGADRMVAFRGASGNALHLYQPDIIAAPMRAVARVYRHCGMTLSAAAEARMQEYLRRVPRGGYAVHHHSLESFGLEAGELGEQFARYMSVFDVQPERLRQPTGAVFHARPA